MSNREGTAIIAGFVFLFVYAVGSRNAQQDANAAILAGFIAVSIFIVGDHLDKSAKNKRDQHVNNSVPRSVNSRLKKRAAPAQGAPVPRTQVKGSDPITPQQINAIEFKLRMQDKEIPDLSKMTSREGSEMLRELM